MLGWRWGSKFSGRGKGLDEIFKKGRNSPIVTSEVSGVGVFGFYF